MTWPLVRLALRLTAAALAVLAVPALVRAQDAPPVDDRPVRSFVLIDQLEYVVDDRPAAVRFNGLGWIGGDYNRLWINAEGAKSRGGSLVDADIQVLYGRLISPFWDFQAGIRHFRPGSGVPSSTSAVIGIQGLAPYRLDVQAAAFLGGPSKVAGRLEVEYDLLLTQRLVAQPRLAMDIAVQEVKDRGISRGINDAEISLRFRYEVRREIAPYVGIAWTRASNQPTIADGAATTGRGLSLVIGGRLWY